MVRQVREHPIDLVEPRQGETTPETVEHSNEQLFHARWNLASAAFHCGMSPREMKMTFHEYCKAHPPIYTIDNDYEPIVRCGAGGSY